MWSKSNADKLKMELSGKREKQLQSIKSKKITEDNVNAKMDSGFLSDANLSCETISKDNIEYNIIKSHENLKKTETKTIVDSGLDIDESCLSELDVDQQDDCLKYECNHNIYFHQNEDGDTYVPTFITFTYLNILNLNRLLLYN